MTSSTLSVTRRIGLSREKPQYRQLLMHSLERYRGANRRIVRPKFCSVSAREVCAIASNSRSDFGAIRCSNRLTSSDLFRARLSRVSTNGITIISCPCQRSQTQIANKQKRRLISDAALAKLIVVLQNAKFTSVRTMPKLLFDPSTEVQLKSMTPPLCTVNL